MANYNHATLLPEAIESILGQTRMPDEFLILDDASTDDSVAVIASYARREPRVQLIRGERNVGVNQAYRRLFESARSAYVHPLAADDKRFPRCLERTMQMAAQFPHAGLIIGQMVVDSDVPHDRRTWGISAWHQALFADPIRFRHEYLEREAPSHSLTATMTFRTAALREVGWYQAALGSWGDTFAANAIGLKYGACYVPEPFAVWRKRATSYSQGTKADPRHALDVIEKASYLMRSPRYREYFPAGYVRRWRRRYRWRTIKEYWRCDLTGEFPPGSPFWIRYRYRLPRTWQALRLFWHHTDLSGLEAEGK